MRAGGNLLLTVTAFVLRTHVACMRICARENEQMNI
jgi:hypothetical protein